MQQLPLGVRLRDRATFASFHEPQRGPAALLRALASDEGVRMLYLHGPAGSGKSHLLQAACAAVPGSAYFPLRHLLAAGPGVLEGADRLPLAAIDDLDAVAGEDRWERALFNLYNDCEAAQVRVAFAASAPAGALPLRLPDLRSRLQAVLPVKAGLLDDDGQRQALQLHAAQRGLELTPETAQFLQRHFPRDMTSLVALLDRLDAASLREQRRLTVPFIRQVISGQP